MDLAQLEGRWDAIEDGAEFHYGEGWYVTLRSTRCVGFQLALAKATAGTPYEGFGVEKLLAAIDDAAMDVLAVVGDVIADELVVTWRGLERSGEPVEHGKEIARTIAKSKGLWGGWVLIQASRGNRYGVQILEAAVEKPSASSGLKSPTGTEAKS